MPFTLVRGTFHPGFGEPDGDSVRFAPDDLSLVQHLPRRGRPLDIKTNDGIKNVQLRYEGIDAMEKDARPVGAANGLALESKESNLSLLGYVKVTAPTPRGYILSSALEANGRPVSVVFAGDPPEADGSVVFLTPARFRKSVNVELARLGMVYPMYYMSLYKELRDVLTEAVEAARAADSGVWKFDRSNSGFAFQTKAAAKTLPPIYPKLYRRLQKTNATTVAAFIESPVLQGERLALPDGRFISLGTALKELSGSKLKLLHKPEEMVFLEEGGPPVG